DPALERGARVKRVGAFMGQPLEWITEVETVHFPHVLALRVVNGPFTGTLRYDIQRSNGGSRVRIRAAGDITRPVLAPAALIAEPLRAALAADLDRLRQLIEAGR